MNNITKPTSISVSSFAKSQQNKTLPKRITLLSAMLAGSLLLTACTPSDNEAKEQATAEVATQEMTNNTEATVNADAPTGEISIATNHGEMSIPVNPSPIAVYDMTIMQDLTALGVPMDGVPNPDKLYLDNLTMPDSKAQAIGTLFEPNLEAVSALAPQAIFIGGRMSEKYNDLTQVAPTFDLSLDQGNMYESSKALLAKLGRVFNKTDKAKDLQADIDNAITQAKEAAAGKGNGLVILVNGNKVSAHGAQSRFSFVHKQFGVPMADPDIEDASHGMPVSFEYIKQVNPDWLFVLDRTSAIGKEGVGAEQVLDNALVHQTTAWKNDQVVYLSPDSYLAYGGYYQWMTDAQAVTDAFSKK